MIRRSIAMGDKERKRYFLVFAIVIIFISTMFSGCVDIRCSYVHDCVVSQGWYENTALRNSGMQFLGFEKWCSLTYEINGRYPASLTVTTIKTLLLTDEEEVQKKTKQTLEKTFQNRIQLTTNISGERKLQNNHKTIYIIYDGFDVQKQENVKIIGEVWNCDSSGSSIICIGVAYITSKEIQNVTNTENWFKIVMDSYGTIDRAVGENGLIGNICCH